MKSRIKKGDTVKIVKSPVFKSKYGYCCGYDANLGKVGIVENSDGMHINIKKLGGCYQPEQLNKIPQYKQLKK
jgi:hypothetical protein